ncbi:DUF7537 family lipoprotein [Halapricum desulfuricans]|uniref:Lipoprotein n=1 Tax=Halapricum desulfuricans TaxID=2841257 RepID=A0A897NU30_9EURY|nr:hypothetical protein [Halapricum desulfuricans]QSG15934.1 Uncharacterized protein HSEST_2423 [Halapricum desulfuricans]
MTQKLLVALLFGLVIVLAGCSGGTGDGPAASPTTDTPVDSGNDTTDEPPATDEPPTTDDPDDWERTNARVALESAGSYTSTWVWRSNADDVEEMTFTARVDFTTDRVHNTMRIGGEEVTLIDNYYADGVQHTRFSSNDGSDASYFQSESSFDDAGSVWDYGFAYDTSAFEEWTNQGTETYDGVTVRRYVYEATDQYLGGQTPDSEFDVASARFELLVDRDGVPRYQLYEVEGTDSDGTSQWFEWELTISDVGSTTVEAPDWVQQVRQ